MASTHAIRQRKFERHRAIGLSILGAGPVIVATLAMLTVHSTDHDTIVGRADPLVVQNVMVTFAVALLVFLMGIAFFVTLISSVLGHRSVGPGMMPRFGAAAQTSAIFFLNGFLQMYVDGAEAALQQSAQR